MRILIYGAGAIGSDLGALLTASGEDVTLLARGAQFIFFEAVHNSFFSDFRRQIKVNFERFRYPMIGGARINDQFIFITQIS